MAQYLFSVVFGPEDAPRADAAEDAAIDVFNDELRAGGHWVFAAGLGGDDTATVVDGRGGAPVFTDGPYLESKEHVGGFWIVEAPDLDVALRLAGRASVSCNRRVEVRPVLSE